MFQKPYDTTVCRQYHMQPIEKALSLARVEGRLLPVTTSSGHTYAGVMSVSPSDKTTPPFTQPYRMADQWVVDARAYLRLDRDGVPRAVNPGELDFLLLRAALSAAWDAGRQEELLYAVELPLRTYIRFVAESMTRRLGLDALSQLHLSILAGWFYLCLWESTATWDASESLRYANRVASAIGVGADVVLPILEQQTRRPLDMEAFTQCVVDTVRSPRVAQLTPALLVASIGGAWFGAHAKETVAVALEYPPYWNALIYSALTDRTYHTAQLSKLVQQIDRKQLGVRYQRQLVDYLSITKD